MTQEDLRCDPCRDGCSLITIAGTVTMHVLTAGMHITRTWPAKLT